MEHIIKMIPNPVNWFMTHEFNNLKKLNWTVERKCINLSWHHDQEVIYKCITPKFVLQWMSRSSHQTCSMKKVLLEISQNAQENICARISFLIKLRERPTTLLKIDSAQVFSCEFCEILRTRFYIEPFLWLLVNV